MGAFSLYQGQRQALIRTKKVKLYEFKNVDNLYDTMLEEYEIKSIK